MKRKGREVRSGRWWPAPGKGTRAFNYFRNQPFGSVRIVRRNELLNLVEVTPDFRAEI